MSLDTAGGFLGQALTAPATATYSLWVCRDGSGVRVDDAVALWARVIAERGFEPAGVAVTLTTGSDGGVYAVGEVRPARGLPTEH